MFSHSHSKVQKPYGKNDNNSKIKKVTILPSFVYLTPMKRGIEVNSRDQI